VNDSRVLTVGTVLRLAWTAQAPVRLLLSTGWLDGVVMGVDQHGAVIRDGRSHVVVRLEAVSAVKVDEEVTQSEHHYHTTPIPLREVAAC
jgi:hypothetical protein